VNGPRGAILLAALVLVGCVAGRDADDGADLAEALAGRTAGTAHRCIGLTLNTGPHIAGDALIYRDGRRLWVSQPVGGCPSLRGDPITIVEVTGNQLCVNDRFRTVERGGIGIPGPYCRFGPFVPWTARK
jgi:hypothetical protein